MGRALIDAESVAISYGDGCGDGDGYGDGYGYGDGGLKIDET